MELSHLTGQQLPEGWSVRPLGQLSGFITKGATPTTYGYSWQSDGVVFLRSECVSDHGLDLSEAAFISEKAHAALNRGEVRSGDLLVTITGYVGRAVLLDDDFGYGNINQHIARVRITDQSVDPKYVLYHLSQPEVRDYYESITTGQAYPQISLRQVRETPIPLPPPEEQRAIAAALSEVDDLVAALDALIEKKRAVKTAAMQRLLTGRQRLPGFSGEWETKRLGEVTAVIGGGTPKSTISAYWDGGIRWCTPTDITSCSGKYLTTTARTISELGLNNSAARLLPPGALLLCTRATLGEVRIAVEPTATNQGFQSLVCGPSVDNEYLYYLVATLKPAMEATASGSTFLEISRGSVASLKVCLPPLEEQRAIAAVLSDMDAEVAALEARREKTRLIKQGMMQELLTGRTRLVQSVAAQPVVTRRNDAPTVPARPHPVRRAKDRGHNWVIDEAVVLGCLADRFATPEWPIGRQRRIKLMYLLRRHTGKAPEGYLKKAAGPYKPQTKYGGPEKIAKKNGYVRDAKGRVPGFASGDNIEQARGYFADWYGEDALDWLDRFRYVKTKDLGALTTVDYAALELRREGKAVTVEAIKGVLAADEAWAPKLQQPEFTDEKIKEAIRLSEELFGTELPDES